MNSNEILRMVVKLTGLVLFIIGITNAASYIPMLFEAMKHGDMGTVTASYLGAIISPTVIGVFLWLFPASVANTVIRKDFEVSLNKNIIQEIEVIGIRILGFYLLYLGISDLFFNILTYKHEMEIIGNDNNFFSKGNIKVAIIVTCIEISIAVGLIFGSKIISTLIRKIKFAS